MNVLQVLELQADLTKLRNRLEVNDGCQRIEYTGDKYRIEIISIEEHAEKRENKENYSPSGLLMITDDPNSSIEFYSPI